MWTCVLRATLDDEYDAINNQAALSDIASNNDSQSQPDVLDTATNNDPRSQSDVFYVALNNDESYFGLIKMSLLQQATTLGKPPIKIGRVIKLIRKKDGQYCQSG